MNTQSPLKPEPYSGSLFWNTTPRTGIATEGAGAWSTDSRNGSWDMDHPYTAGRGRFCRSWGDATNMNACFGCGAGAPGTPGNITVQPSGIAVMQLSTLPTGNGASYTIGGGQLDFGNFGYLYITHPVTINSKLLAASSTSLRKYSAGALTTTATASGCLPQFIDIHAGEWRFSGQSWAGQKLAGGASARLTIHAGATATIVDPHSLGGSNTGLGLQAEVVVNGGTLLLLREQYFSRLTINAGGVVDSPDSEARPSVASAWRFTASAIFSAKVVLYTTLNLTVDTGMTATFTKPFITPAGYTGQLVMNGPGTAILTAPSPSFSSHITLAAGVLRAGALTAFGTGPITLAAGATLDMGGFPLANAIVNNGGTIIP